MKNSGSLIRLSFFVSVLCCGLSGCQKAAQPADAYSVPERHRPLAVMGRDYWTLLFSFYYTDPGYLAQCKGSPEWMDSPELAAKPVFRDCALVMRGDAQQPDPEKGKATYRTLKEYYATNGRWEQLMRNPKPDKPMILTMGAMRGTTSLAGEIDVDRADYEAWRAKQPNFFAIETVGEWESDVNNAWWNCTIWSNNWRHSHKILEEVKAFLSPWPTSRYERIALQKKFFDRKTAMHWGDLAHAGALRASVAIDHLAAAWGAKFLMLETTNTARPPQEYRWNIQPMFIRGAARQFNVPWEWYVAQYINGYRRDGAWMDNSAAGYSWGWPTAKDIHPSWGISPSLNRRAFYMAYVSGANFIEQEGWYSTFLEPDPVTKKARFSVRGQAFSDFHDFTVAHPNRGTPYTPVAVLVPFAQGYQVSGGRSWGCYAYTPGDQTVDAVFFTIDPGYDRETFMKKGGEANLHNSKYAMMYDVVCPDAPQKPAELLAALTGYKAVILTGDYPDKSFETTLAAYEKAGGRVIRIDPKSLPPIENEKETVDAILTGKRTFPTVAKILDGLQTDYFPFRVDGDVMYGANRTDTGWWLWCFNNKGVTKFADTFAETDATKTSDITVKFGSGSHELEMKGVRELLSGKAVEIRGGSFSHTIAPGDLAIFEIR